jgi:hypothetical protein
MATGIMLIKIAENCMTVIIEGVYKQGKIELSHPPADLPEGRVRVILIPQDDRPQTSRRMMTFGCLGSGDTSTLEDFEYPDAEWQMEWDDADGQ